MKKKALITGITGQIGSYLAEILLEKGYEVYGFSRESSKLVFLRDNAKAITFKYGALEDLDSVERAIKETSPDEIYNLGAQSSSQISKDIPEETFKANTLALVRMLEVARKLNPGIKICQASSAELYGGVYDRPVNEETQFCPRNPYGTAKLAAYWLIHNYREIHKMFCANGIIFNSESPRRGEQFVTKKIAKAVAHIVKGKQDTLYLGNLNTKRDWGHAKDTARALWLALQHSIPQDYVIATGIAHTVREFVELAFKYAGKEIAWRGSEINEQGYDKKTEKVYVKIDPQFFRPAELKVLLGDASKAKRELGWQPSYTFEQLVKEMVEAELQVI